MEWWLFLEVLKNNEGRTILISLLVSMLRKIIIICWEEESKDHSPSLEWNFLETRKYCISPGKCRRLSVCVKCAFTNQRRKPGSFILMSEMLVNLCVSLFFFNHSQEESISQKIGWGIMMVSKVLNEIKDIKRDRQSKRGSLCLLRLLHHEFCFEPVEFENLRGI